MFKVVSSKPWLPDWGLPCSGLHYYGEYICMYVYQPACNYHQIHALLNDIPTRVDNEAFVEIIGLWNWLSSFPSFSCLARFGVLGSGFIPDLG